MSPLVLAVVAVLITYGSLYPFHFVAPPDTSAAVQSLLLHSPLWTSFGDLLGNIGLFVPFGLVGMGTLSRGPARGREMRAAIATLVLGLLLAVVLQFIQIYVPERTATMGDVVWNMLGVAIGMVGAELLRVIVLPRGLAGASPVPVMLLVLWIVAELAPLVPQLDFGGFKDALKPLLLHPTLDIPDAVYRAAQVLLVARLVAEVAVDLPTFPLIVGLLGVVGVGKLFVETQVIDVTTVLAFTGGLLVWIADSRTGARLTDGVLLLILIGAYSLQELSPFQLRDTPASFSWIPFAASLEGSMLSNLRALAASAFTMIGSVWLIRGSVSRVRVLGGIIAGWALLLELAQTWIVGRSPSITESVLALTAGFMVPALAWSGLGAKANAGTSPPVAHVAAPPSSRVPALGAFAVPGFTVLAWVIAVVVGMRLVLTFPGVPYNVREMFADGAGLSARVFFALAVLWIGAGAMLLAHALTRTRHPYLVLPIGALAVAMVSKFLVGQSLSYESMDDVLGSDMLYRAVTGEGVWSTDPIWGPFWQHLFLQINAPSLIDFLERRVRYTALYSPPIVCIALALTPYLRARLPWNVITPVAELATAAVAFFWLVLCHQIVWPWAGTDNLTELLAPGGPFEYAHALYLYGIVVIAAINVALLVQALETRRGWPAALACSIVAIAAGWQLLGMGLSSHVEKYDVAFSATQFLLGPERRGTLSESTLFARWAFVQTALVAAAVVGAWTLDRLLIGLSPLQRRARGAAPSAAWSSARNA